MIRVWEIWLWTINIWSWTLNVFVGQTVRLFNVINNCLLCFPLPPYWETPSKISCPWSWANYEDYYIFYDHWIKWSPFGQRWLVTGRKNQFFYIWTQGRQIQSPERTFLAWGRWLEGDLIMDNSKAWTYPHRTVQHGNVFSHQRDSVLNSYQGEGKQPEEKMERNNRIWRSHVCGWILSVLLQ